MAGRSLEGVAKVCQRRLYSWLSSRCGLPVCVVGTILLLVSVLQFGEVLLEWSKEKYEYQFSIYADNIAGKSYETYLCPELPIDVVYTWVNGSDPELLEALRELKSQSATSEPALNSTPTAASTSQEKSNDSQSLSCPFSLCVPFHTVLLDAQPLPHLILSSLPSLSPLLANASAVHMVNSPAAHLSPVHAVQLTSEEQVTRVLTADVKDSTGQKIRTTRGFLTNDSSVLGAVRMESFVIVVGTGISPNTTTQLRKWMDARFRGNLTAVEVKGEGLGVAEFRPGVLAEIFRRLEPQQQLSFSGHHLQLFPAYLIWSPFSTPGSEGDNKTTAEGGGGASDDISASRFADNEEMRYSLRSVVRYAPWIRHIFIVTNGQIPYWLNLDNPRITLVTHEEIFPNKSHLPTFSSPAIETHLHRIPGLSKRFIYLNDDVMFGAPIWPEDFYTPQRGQKVYLSWPVPYCAEGCPPNWITDNYCDQACNSSICDWDGGDCAGATRYGWRGGGGGGGGGGGFETQHTLRSENCNAGCLNNWLGDRYCDQACRVPSCGYDAGDCGTELWETLYSVVPRPNQTHSIPLGTTAMFFNLTKYFTNGTISSAEHGPCPVVRTAVLAQTFKTLSLTFSKNSSVCVTTVTVNGTTGSGAVVTLTFALSADTVTRNESHSHESRTDSFWNFPQFNTTHSDKFLEAVVQKIHVASNTSLNYDWRTEHSPALFTAAPVTEYTRYTVSNRSLLPVDITDTLAQLEAELKAGDITSRGYLKRRGQILEKYPHFRQANGSVTFRAGGGEGAGPVGGATRRLLSIHVPDEVREEPIKSLRDDIIQAVTSWEHTYGPWDPNYKGWERRRLPWERLRIFPEEVEGVQGVEGVRGGEGDLYSTASRKGRHLMDVYGDSLRFVNKLLTRAYGHDARKVPAHMPHMINREVMDELHSRYPVEFDETSAHKLRSSNDMQFSFSYFYYLLSEKRSMDISNAFSNLDSDQSGILSVRELRTMLAMISELPLHLEIVHNFEALLRECDSHYNGTRPSVDPIEYETHYDPNLPLVTLEFVRQCQPLLAKLNSTVHTQLKYKFEVVGEEQVAFKMINENATKVMEMLDEIRKENKKFICLNDNIDHLKEGAHLAKLILQDFYESMFPHPSTFELPPQYRNRFLHVSELNEWLQFRGRVQLGLHVICGVLLALTVTSLFYGKLIQWKRRIVRHCLSLVYRSRDRTRPPSV